MKLKLVFVLVTALALASCGGEKPKKDAPAGSLDEKKTEAVTDADPMSNKGIGPISSVTLGEIDQAMVTEGEAVFKAKCTACHKISKKFVGPALKGVTQRRTPEWIMNMTLNPEEMIAKDPIAKQLLAEANGAPMANQNITEEEARALLEYFRTKN
ncbi:cytochrome c [Lutimonas saemankumensis]|uniref:c-type cytochrome n=1 Tax=Lutimonas saemankumensis TaxID=483016 RepID=UPI001CD1A947|nr:cytochrome c [Lutimonas saemankumensis]MCA0933432.1 cytochrome c [Lutimonas saemankumensis]